MEAIITRKVPHVFYGGDYNPEQWPEEVWDEDVRLMREAGVNLVSLGIFSWAKLEPQPGEYDFGWLDWIMDLLHENGVMVDLATASPPPWLARLHPESLSVRREGTALHPGARQHYCPSSPAYWERAAGLVRRVAYRYKDHLALAMWHVNNEYSVHVQACYCEVSAAHFRVWLRARYGDLDALIGARAEVAILLDWNSWWALELDSKPSKEVRLPDGIRSFYAPLYAANVPVDFAHPGTDLSPYKLVVAPNLYLVTDDAAENIRRFVAEGGTLLMSFFSGIVDTNDHIRLGGYPAPFREPLGLLVEDFGPMAAAETNRIETEVGASFECDLWADLVHETGAEPLATYAESFYAGAPAVTRHAFGRGTAYYLGPCPERRYVEGLVQIVCEQAGVSPTLKTPPGVDAVRRKTEDASFLFVLNHIDKAAEVSIPAPGRDLLTKRRHDSMLVLDPLGVAVLESEVRG